MEELKSRERRQKATGIGARCIGSAGSEALRIQRTAARPLRVLLIGHQFQVATEGQAKAAALSKFDDLDIQVLCPERYKEAEVRWRHPKAPAGAKYLFRSTEVRNAWAGSAKWYLQSYCRLEEILTCLRPDVIDLWEEPWSLLSLQVLRLRKRCLPECCFISETEQNIFKNLPPPFEWFRSETFKHADYLIARNTEAVDVARRKGYTGPARVVGNGVDTRLFRPMDRFICRRELGAEGFVVGYAGRLVREKGIETLLRAFRKLNGKKLLVLSGDGPLREDLCREPFVKWLGVMPREGLPVFYNSLDALVLPSLTTVSWKEQFGRVLVEAQACRTPVVGSDSGAIPEVIGQTGLVFAEGDAHRLYQALGRLQAEAALGAELARLGLAKVASRYSWEAIATAMREVYLESFSDRRRV